MLIGLLLFLLGCGISAVASSVAVLLIGGLVQSIGAGCGITLARAIARDVYDAGRLVKAIAYLTMFFALGGLLAPGMGGFLVDQLGWRAVFSFAGIMCLAIALAAYFVVPETSAPNRERKSSAMLSSFVELCRQPRFCAGDPYRL